MFFFHIWTLQANLKVRLTQAMYVVELYNTYINWITNNKNTLKLSRVNGSNSRAHFSSFNKVIKLDR